MLYARRGWDWQGNECWIVLEPTPLAYAPPWTKVYRARIDYGPVGTKIDLGEVVASDLKMIKAAAADRARLHGFVPRSDWMPFKEIAANPSRVAIVSYVRGPGTSYPPMTSVIREDGYATPVRAEFDRHLLPRPFGRYLVGPRDDWSCEAFEMSPEEALQRGWTPIKEKAVINPMRMTPVESFKPFRKVYIPVTCQTPGCPWQGRSFTTIIYEGPSSGLDPFYESLGTGGEETAVFCPACKKLGVVGDPRSRRPKRNPVQNQPSCPQCGGEGGYLGNLGAWEWFRCIRCGWEFSPAAKRKRKSPRRRRGGLSEASHYLTETNPGKKLLPGDKYAIRRFLGRVHVGTSDAEVEQMIRELVPANAPAGLLNQAIKYALAEHHRNQVLYHKVMTGHF